MLMYSLPTSTMIRSWPILFQLHPHLLIPPPPDPPDYLEGNPRRHLFWKLFCIASGNLPSHLKCTSPSLST